MKWSRIPIAVVAAVAGYFAARGGRGGATVQDLKHYDLLGISAELASSPEPFEIPIPPEAQGKVLSIENQQAKRRNFESMVSRMVCAPGIQASAEGALNGAIQNIVTTQKLTLVSQERKPISLPEASGYRYTAVFRKGSEGLEMQGVILTKDAKLWQVFSVYLQANSESRETAARVADSVKLLP
jgi:hypothetical protein